MSDAPSGSPDEPEEVAHKEEVAAALARRTRELERMQRIAAATSLLAAVVGFAGSLAAVVGEVAGVFHAVLEFGGKVTVDFYRQTSQIIPVLLLAVAIERRVFDVEREQGGRLLRALAYGLALAAVVIAELISVYAVAANRVQAFFLPITAGVLIALLILVVAVALGGVAPPRAEE
jgi:hypothetical protein